MTGGDALVARLLRDAEPLLADPPRGADMAVLFPQDLDPFERHYRFGMMVDAELRLAGVGCDCGGGTLYLVDEDDDDEELAITVLEIEATDVDGARAVLRLHLPELGCPAGTAIQFGEDGEDRFDGANWHLDVPRSFDVED